MGGDPEQSGQRGNALFRRGEWESGTMTQNNLGAALQALGARESGTARLEEAVAAYRMALEERTRERVPHSRSKTRLINGGESHHSPVA